jgi:dCTP deaminase
MAVLARDEILKLVRSGAIKIRPFDESLVGAGSIDLHLGSTFRVFRKPSNIIHVEDRVDYKTSTTVVKLKKNEYIIIQPGELVHGVTEENITLPSSLSGRIEGRSRFARIGLLTHVSSGFMQPGSSGKIVLEIVNLSPMTMALHPGTKVCQVVLEEVKGRGSYKGKFAGQISP